MAKQSTTRFTAVSGKDHPELISDATAYLHLFRTLSRTGAESEALFARRRLAFARRTALGKNQILLLLSAADAFNAQMKTLDALPPAVQRTVEARDARAQVIMKIVAQLQLALGSYDASVLAQHVNTVIKPTIVVYVPKP